MIGFVVFIKVVSRLVDHAVEVSLDEGCWLAKFVTISMLASFTQIWDSPSDY